MLIKCHIWQLFIYSIAEQQRKMKCLIATGLMIWEVVVHKQHRPLFLFLQICVCNKEQSKSCRDRK